MRGQRAKHSRLGILVLILGNLDLHLVGGASSDVLDIDIRDLEVFNGVAGNASDVGAVAGGGVVTGDVGEKDAAQRADDGALVARALGPAQARAEAKEDRAADNVAHGDVGDGDVFQQRAVDRFESESLAALEDAVGDGDVLESAVGLGAALDAPGASDLAVGLHRELLPCAVENRAELIAAADEAVGDVHVLAGAVVAEGEAGLGNDGVVPRGVDGAVGDADVLAAVNVHAVAVGVDL